MALGTVGMGWYGMGWDGPRRAGAKALGTIPGTLCETDKEIEDQFFSGTSELNWHLLL
jgi:hypothetical protein